VLIKGYPSIGLLGSSLSILRNPLLLLNIIETGKEEMVEKKRGIIPKGSIHPSIGLVLLLYCVTIQG